MQMSSWLTDPRVPRRAVGAISEMYRGTSAEERPMPRPASSLPARMVVREVAQAHKREPARVGMTSRRRAFLRPKESARPLPAKLPMAAPARRLLTTAPSRAASDAKPRSAAMAWRGPLTTPRW